MALYRPKVYTASKIRHKTMWRQLALEYPEIEFTARWVTQPDGPDHDTTFWTAGQKTLHWIFDVQDVQRSDFVLGYKEPEDTVAGTLVEIGCAIGLGKIVLAVGFEVSHSWQAHPLIVWRDTKHSAINFILGKGAL